MEKEPAKEVKEHKELVLKLSSYSVSIRLQGDKIHFKANSDILGKLFVGTFAQSDMNEFQREYLQDCSGVFELLEECVNEKRSAELTDTGLLKFVYMMKVSRKNEISKTLEFTLKELEISEFEKLVMRVDRLERENTELKCRLDKLGQDEFAKLPNAIDMSGTSIAQLSVSGQEITSNKGVGSWLPVTLSRKLQGKHYFEMEISAISSNGLMIGVAAENLKNSVGAYSHSDCVCLYPAGSTLYYGGASKSVTCSWTNGDRIAVKVDTLKKTVEWEFSYPIIKQIVKCALPPSMTDKNLYPIVYMLGSYNDRIRFL